jgi:hypothetical protein
MTFLKGVKSRVIKGFHSQQLRIQEYYSVMSTSLLPSFSCQQKKVHNKHREKSAYKKKCLQKEVPTKRSAYKKKCLQKHETP